MLAGVCAGLGEHFRVDPTLVRVIFVVLTLVPPGIGIILYLVLCFLMDPPISHASRPPGTTGQRLSAMSSWLGREFRAAFGPSQGQSPVPGEDPSTPYRRHSGRLWSGIVLIAAGAYLVINNLGYLSGFRWDLLWPVLLIALGLLLLLRRL